MGKNALVLMGLLILGGILAIVVWLLVFLPFRVMQPIEFSPLSISENASERLEQRPARPVLAVQARRPGTGATRTPAE